MKDCNLQVCRPLINKLQILTLNHLFAFIYLIFLIPIFLLLVKTFVYQSVFQLPNRKRYFGTCIGIFIWKMFPYKHEVNAQWNLFGNGTTWWHFSIEQWIAKNEVLFSVSRWKGNNILKTMEQIDLSLECQVVITDLQKRTSQ